MFTQGNGMVFFDIGLFLLAVLASLVSFATYRSRSIAGTPVADHVRSIKSVSWAVCALYLGWALLEFDDAPVPGVILVVLWLCAFSDIVAGLARIGTVLAHERGEHRDSPDTVAAPPP